VRRFACARPREIRRVPVAFSASTDPGVMSVRCCTATRRQRPLRAGCHRRPPDRFHITRCGTSAPRGARRRRVARRAKRSTAPSSICVPSVGATSRRSCRRCSRKGDGHQERGGEPEILDFISCCRNGRAHTVEVDRSFVVGASRACGGAPPDHRGPDRGRVVRRGAVATEGDVLIEDAEATRS